MVKTKYYSQGGYKRIIKFSDNDFTQALLTSSLVYSHTNKNGDWYKDCGCGVYLKVRG